MFEPRGRYEILKCGRQLYFPPLPAPTGTSVFHFAMISLLVSSDAPLSGLPLLFPWRGCAHFLLGRQNVPCSARCLGHIVMLVPSSLNWPVRARIKSFSVRILVCETFTVLRCDRMSLLQEVKEKYSATSGWRYITFFFRKCYKRTKERSHA